MNSSKNQTEQSFVGADVIQLPAAPQSDPFRALDDLMSVVEALCPTWPERGPFVNIGEMLL
jgi:hypothetical protein